ncbi:hypothetical protein SAY86_029804 [Trapa natans]|uniref:Late embryogenesis abundant protein LEA-2 subgroup domain-containing protein n=1 Tax=Trapa natans TaxID=22666 RepID=A0AAN7RHQ1_TRANT|nr:hypothetical protein SAY86_029804 [Trapa natans]
MSDLGKFHLFGDPEALNHAASGSVGSPGLCDQEEDPPPEGCPSSSRYLYWAFSVLMILLVSGGAIVGILYLAYQPEVPKYSISSLKMMKFNPRRSNNLYAIFSLVVGTENPNKNVGIYYDEGSTVRLLYKGYKLCEGPFPEFYQGHWNTTWLQVPLTGYGQYATSLLRWMQQQKQQTGFLDLDLRVTQLVSLKFGRVKVRGLKLVGHCWLDVDNVDGSIISIKETICDLRMRL